MFTDSNRMPQSTAMPILDDHYRNRVRMLFIVLISLLIIGGLGVAFRQQIIDQLNAWALLPQPERLTELYFTDPTYLPKTYTPSQPQTLLFSVHNMEYATVAYDYTIAEVASNGASQVLYKGSFVLRQDSYETVHPTITPLNVGSPVQFVVTLTTVHESINNREELKQ